MMMNIYEVKPKINPVDSYEYSYVWHVIAPTRGRAKYLFISYWNSFGGEYTFTDEMKIKLLGKETDLPEGLDEDYKWARLQGYPDEFFEGMREF